MKPLRGWGAGIRTPIGRSRVGSPTVERHPITCAGTMRLLVLLSVSGILL